MWGQCHYARSVWQTECHHGCGLDINTGGNKAVVGKLGKMTSSMEAARIISKTPCPTLRFLFHTHNELHDDYDDDEDDDEDDDDDDEDEDED